MMRFQEEFAICIFAGRQYFIQATSICIWNSSRSNLSCICLWNLSSSFSLHWFSISGFPIPFFRTFSLFLAYCCVSNILFSFKSFQVATFVSLFAVVYMRIFLEESIPADQGEGITQPILKEGEEDDIIQKDDNAPTKVPAFKKIPSMGDVIYLMKNR